MFGQSLLSTFGPAAATDFLLAGGVASTGKSLRYSTDSGATWSDVTSSGFSNDSVLARVGYNGSYYLAYNINGELSNSTDGINFTAVSSNGGLPATPQMYRVIYFGQDQDGLEFLLITILAYLEKCGHQQVLMALVGHKPPLMRLVFLLIIIMIQLLLGG